MMLALDNKQDLAVRKLLKLGATLPEGVADKPEMQTVTKEVEREVLREQLHAAEQSAGKQQLKAAKQAFEEARQQLIKITVLSATTAITPVIHDAEIRLTDAQELSRTSKASSEKVKERLKVLDAQLSTMQAEAKEKAKESEFMRRELQRVRDSKSEKNEEMKRLKADIESVMKAFEASAAKETGADEATQQAEAEIEELKKTLEELKETGESITSKLYETTAQVDKWIGEKDAVAQLHRKAHELLNKPGNIYGYPGSPAQSMPASPSKEGQASAAEAEKAKAAEGEAKKEAPAK